MHIRLFVKGTYNVPFFIVKIFILLETLREIEYNKNYYKIFGMCFMKNPNADVRVMSRIVSNGEESRIDIKSEASYYKSDGKIYIVYEEDGMSDLGCTETTVIYNGDSVCVERNSGVIAQMKYKRDEHNKCMYNFEFGAICIETDTKKVDVKLDEKGGRIELEYTLNMGGNKSSNQLLIDVNVYDEERVN